MFPTEGIVYIDGHVLLGKFLATEEEGRIKVLTQIRKSGLEADQDRPGM